MSSFSILVQDAPYSSQASLSALHFAKAALASDHTITRLFFYQAGVLNASSLIVPPQDEIHLPKAWQSLIEQHQIDAVVCVSSALKYGVLSQTEADRYETPASSLLSGFVISGLGQLIDAMVTADRHLCFKG